MVIEDCNVRRALKHGEFEPHFQPILDLRTGELCGFELLARWHCPERGWISPEVFIPLAERDGWIDELAQVLFCAGFAAAASLPESLKLSINISAVQLRDRSLPGRIEAIASVSGFSAARLMVEITESAVAQDLEGARAVAQTFKAMGARLALDDFGTGYSSLLRLQSLPFDELKVDRSFVSTMTTQRDSRKIVAAVVGLGQGLGLTTVAEGVETLEQAEMLRWLGCELAQGWHFGRPVPARELAGVVEASTHRLPSAGMGKELDGNPARSPESMLDRLSVSSRDSLPAQRLAQLQAVYDGAPVGLAFLDKQLRYRNLNRRLANMNGRPMEEHLGRTVREMIPEFYPQVEPLIRRALNGEAVASTELAKPDSSPSGARTLLLTYEPARDEAGEVVGVSVAIVDVTPVKKAEAAHKESEAHFRYMIELLPQIPWIIDPEGRALDVSQRWLEITGTAGEDWRGFGWLRSLHPEDVGPTLEAMEEAFQTLTPVDVIYRVRKSEHDPWQQMRSRGAPRLDEDGKAICWYGSMEPVGLPVSEGGIGKAEALAALQSKMPLAEGVERPFGVKRARR